MKFFGRNEVFWNVIYVYSPLDNARLYNLCLYSDHFSLSFRALTAPSCKIFSPVEIVSCISGELTFFVFRIAVTLKMEAIGTRILDYTV